ncbi:MAG TPA: adenosylcobinamide-GDP ribazoletransferase [Alphaproteobacteria bacterium]|nr:adenosylcobinamide-GDP ribazoletransferase [Alphaproteobacteria bacterium]
MTERTHDWRDEIRAAVIFLTRLPLRFEGVMPDALGRRALRWFPVVGLGIGLCAAAVFALAAALGLPAGVAAVLAVMAQVWLTGALHEDGLADTADGFGGGLAAPRKLEIMRDSRLGTYGGAALFGTLALRATALAALAPVEASLALMAAGAVSRGLVPAVAHALPPARPDGLAARQGRPDFDTAALAALIGAAAALPLGFAALPALLLAAAAALFVAWLADRQIGGHTGDVLGATQQAAEVAVLLAVAATWSA